MFNLLASLLAALVPQMDDPPAVQYMWRLKVAGLLSLTALSIPLVVMASTGHLWGFNGFLSRADFDTYMVEARQLRKERLQVDLLAIQAARCKAPSPEARRLYSENIDRLQDQYADLTGRQYPIIDCQYL